jgi:hypothetical protein
MKRKGLTIIFFSVTALAATPRAMHHFHTYIESAQNHAQVELLNFLLSHGVSAEQNQVPPADKPKTAKETTSEQSVAQAETPVLVPVKMPVRTGHEATRRSMRGSTPATLPDQTAGSLETVAAAAARSGLIKFDGDPDAARFLHALVGNEGLRRLLPASKPEQKKLLIACEKELAALGRARMRPAPKHAPAVPAQAVRFVETHLNARSTETAPDADRGSSDEL